MKPRPSRRSLDALTVASVSREICAVNVLAEHAGCREARAESSERVPHPLDPRHGKPTFVALVERRNDLVRQQMMEGLRITCVLRFDVMVDVAWERPAV